MTESPRILLKNTDKLILRIEADKNLYRFSAASEEPYLVSVGTGRTQLLSSEVTSGSFTGCFAGLFAEGAAEAVFRYFTAEEK